ncbi:hypothetical protein [Streptacidiphilus fuscans]|uniref:Uncharacterized protein n=1 Tax=Streptacidiphilus fuscans TaxID=2789292 RepID=A0A931B7J9_9ACTN|nr:hypothetical protein [Streptacidiphilus fuscans]MBF9072569.1 hypothetical protein [Streptacidiphilus fuscans]
MADQLYLNGLTGKGFQLFQQYQDALGRVSRDVTAIREDRIRYGGNPDEDPTAAAFKQQTEPEEEYTQQLVDGFTEQLGATSQNGGHVVNSLFEIGDDTHVPTTE